MGLGKILSWWEWLLKFNIVKYAGLSVMFAGPLFFVYAYLYRATPFLYVAIGSIVTFAIGFIIWLNGWDPYEDIIGENQAYTFMMTLKEFFTVVEWYKWLLSFNPVKYLSLAIMTAGPMYFVYRIVFLKSDSGQMLLYATVVFVIGMVIWIASWDPYS